MSEKNTNDKKTGEMKKKRYNPEQKCEDLIRKLREQCGSHNISYYALAKEADVVVIVAGNDYLDEGECVANESVDVTVQNEGGDRTDCLGLKEEQLRIIDAVGKVRQDAVVVLVGGSMILMDEWEDQVGAILMAYYPGMEGGKAVADVLFGKTNPGGKLPFVIPKKKEDLPEIDWDAEEFRYDYYHGYTLLNKSHVKPLYPFGYGLSYTTFTLASVIAKNTGKWEGSEVVQMYVGAADSKVERPEYVLKDFQKIRLDAGEEKEVKLVCPIREMAYFDEGRNEFVAEFSIPYEVYVGTSSLREDLWVRKV